MALWTLRRSMTATRLAASRAELEAVLTQARRYGFLGPGEVGPHIEHASQYNAALGVGEGLARFVDLGAGGGLPSLPMLVANDRLSAVLLDASQKRCSFLVWASIELGLSERVEVCVGRAEEFAHEPKRRGSFDAVVARGFGPPAWTVECAAPLLRPGGLCVISEPPDLRDWPVAALAEVGLRVVAGGPPGVAVFAQGDRAPSRYPRRAAEQRRTPLF